MRDEMMPTYAPPENMVVTSGKGPFLYTEEGREYLDFVSGIAVNCFGHAHPELTAALHKQAQALWHTSNMFRIPQAERLATRLAQHSFGDRVFFANSGAEAVEAAIKTARRYHYECGEPDRQRIITFASAFHGRTIATVAAGKNEVHMKGFFRGDLDFDQVPFEDINALEAMISDQTAAVLLEPIQGEGGVRAFSDEFLKEVRDLCDAKGVLLIFDEVQCGIGRSGELFTYQTTGVEPDIMSLAKGLGGGFPIGACISTEEVGSKMIFGTHGTTFGGNPMACAVANKVLDLVLADNRLAQIRTIAAYFQDELRKLASSHPKVFGELSGKGLMLGLSCRGPNTDVLVAAREHGLLIAKSGGNKVRFLPPLNIEPEHVDRAITVLTTVAQQLESTDS